MSDKFNFKKGDVVVAKDDFLNPGETLKDTLGVVVSYNPDNDYLVIGEIFKGNHFFNHTFSARGEFYRLVTPKELKEFDLKEENKMSESTNSCVLKINMDAVAPPCMLSVFLNNTELSDTLYIACNPGDKITFEYNPYEGDRFWKYRANSGRIYLINKSPSDKISFIVPDGAEGEAFLTVVDFGGTYDWQHEASTVLFDLNDSTGWVKNLRKLSFKESKRTPDVNRVVNKILEGADVRKTLSLTESNTTSMRIQSFVDVFFSDNVDYSIVANEFVWFNALLDMSKKVQADFNKTFEDEDLEWDEWFYTHWGVSIDFEFDDLAVAPDCDKAGLSSSDLSYYVATHCDVDYVDQYGGDLYLVAKPFV
jgi:hypothetical protein